MGYLGQEASFTGTQNNKRLSVVATAGQVSFFITNGYAINAIDVYRNGVKLIGQRDFSAIDGVTVTLTQAANVNDVIEFVIFENFAVNDVVSTEGDSVIKGNLQINGNFSVVNGTLSAGISSALGVGATAVGLNASGIITATSFDGALSGAATQVTVADESSDTTCFPLFATAASGDLAPKSGTNLTFNSDTGALTATSFVGAVTGNADTATTSTNVTVADESSDTTCFPLFATAATGNLPPKSGTNLTFNSSTGALTATSFVGALTGAVTGNADTATNASGLTGTPNISCGTGAFSGNVTLQANLDLQDDDKILLGTGDDLEIYHSGTYNRSYIQATGTNHDLTIAGDQITLGNSAISETLADFNAGGAVELYHANNKKFETSATGVTVTGTLNATTAVTQNGKGLASTGKAIAMAMVFG